MPISKNSNSGELGVTEYKSLLKSILDRRPSGTRKRLAEALEKNRSFVSQFSNPVYKTPIPSRHLDTIFEVCHFSQAEKDQFMRAYRQAHPRWEHHQSAKPATRSISLVVPDLGQKSSNQELEHLVEEFARHAAKLLSRAGKSSV